MNITPMKININKTGCIICIHIYNNKLDRSKIEKKNI